MFTDLYLKGITKIKKISFAFQFNTLWSQVVLGTFVCEISILVYVYIFKIYEYVNVYMYLSVHPWKKIAWRTEQKLKKNILEVD